jgi:hypothetical protein
MFYTKHGSSYGDKPDEFWYMALVPVLNFSLAVVIMFVFIIDIYRLKTGKSGGFGILVPKAVTNEKVENILDRLDEKDIEKYLRKKKLNKLN